MQESNIQNQRMKRAVNKRFLNIITYYPRYFFRKVTSFVRYKKPDFIIIGAQKAGTTSVYNYLIKHPNVLASFRKEVCFFDYCYYKGMKWYNNHFPSKLTELFYKYILRRRLLTGEATPDYFVHPNAPKRISETLPDVKLILVLRNPIDRAYSHYNHERKGKNEELSFEEAIEKEEERMNGEIQKISQDEHFFSYNLHHHGYLYKGIYEMHLSRWFDEIPRDRILIIDNQDLKDNTPQVMNTLTEFLEIPKFKLPEYKKYYSNKYSKMSEATRDRLKEYYKEHNMRLSELLGVSYNKWDD
jgi:hypothetical protein